MSNATVYKQKYEFDYKGDFADAIHRVGGNVEFENSSQPNFVITQGLEPKHKFLDLGCGCLRGTAPLIDYLEDGNFFGADVSSGLIKAAHDRVERMGLKNRPMLGVINDFKFEDFRMFGQKFDFVLAVSLLTHLMPESVIELFHGIKKILNPDGVFYFTIIPTALENFSGDVELMRYKKLWLGSQAQNAGLILYDRLGDFPNEVPDYKVMDRVNYKGIGQWMLMAVPE